MASGIVEFHCNGMCSHCKSVSLRVEWCSQDDTDMVDTMKAASCEFYKKFLSEIEERGPGYYPRVTFELNKPVMWEFVRRT